ncbi:MAG: class I tRNA ligase family protein [bacterium]|nr:class I tRNA ligase family protein [bacterium]
MLVGSTPGGDIRYSEERISYFWRFLNKLRNASRFVLMKTEIDTPQNYEQLRQIIEEQKDQLNEFDHRILSKINKLIIQSSQEMDKFMLGEFAQHVVDAVWHDFCDRYIEISKQEM